MVRDRMWIWEDGRSPSAMWCSYTGKSGRWPQLFTGGRVIHRLRPPPPVRQCQYWENYKPFATNLIPKLLGWFLFFEVGNIFAPDLAIGTMNIYYIIPVRNYPHWDNFTPDGVTYRINIILESVNTQPVFKNLKVSLVLHYLKITEREQKAQWSELPS